MTIRSDVLSSDLDLMRSRGSSLRAQVERLSSALTPQGPEAKIAVRDSSLTDYLSGAFLLIDRHNEFNIITSTLNSVNFKSNLSLIKILLFIPYYRSAQRPFNDSIFTRIGEITVRTQSTGKFYGPYQDNQDLLNQPGQGLHDGLHLRRAKEPGL